MDLQKTTSIPVTYSIQDEIFHFIVSGKMNNGENRHIWKHLQDIAHEHAAKRILIECSISCGRISMEHCFDLIERIPFISRRLTCKIALFEKHMSEDARGLLKFIEKTAITRGAYFRLFSELQDAKLWLAK